MANYWKEEYLSKLRSAEEAVREIREGDTVILGHCIAEPKALVDAMVANAQQYHDVEVRHMFSLGGGEYAAPNSRGTCGQTPFLSAPTCVLPLRRDTVTSPRYFSTRSRSSSGKSASAATFS